MASESDILPDKILSLGRIQRPKGLQGQLRVTTRGDLLASLKAGSQLGLYRAEKMVDGFLVKAVFYAHKRLQKISELAEDHLVLTLDLVDNADKADELRGLFVGLPLAEARTLFGGQSEPYLFEYIDLQVSDDQGRQLGKIVRIEEHGPASWFVVKMDAGGREVQIPLHAPYVHSPDFRAMTIVMDHLLDFLE